MNRRWTSRWSGPVSALVLTFVAALTLWTAYGYNRLSGLFPVFIGWVFLALALAEAVRELRRLAGSERAGPVDGAKAAVLREVTGVAWLSGFLLLIWLGGFLLATPLFMFAFLRFAGGRSIAAAAAVALGATAIVYGVFAVLLEYRLYAGLIFGA